MSFIKTMFGYSKTNGAKQSGMEWSEEELNKDIIPLFEYFMTKENNFIIPPKLESTKSDEMR